MSAVLSGPHRRSSGITLVETLIAMSITAVILVPLGQFFLESSDAMSSLASRVHATTRMAAVMDRLLSELVSGRFASMEPPLAENSPRIRFEKVIESASPPVYGDPIEIGLVPLDSDPPDGIDNDGDGLIDEHGLRIWKDAAPFGSSPGAEDSPAVVASTVAPGGLRFTRNGAILFVEIDFFVRPDPDEPPETIRLASAVRMRNSN